MTGLVDSFTEFPPAPGGWNPADQTPSSAGVFTFSNANKTLLYTAGVNTLFAGVRGLTSHAAGRYYFEIQVDAAYADANAWSGGIMGSNETLIDAWDAQLTSIEMVGNGLIVGKNGGVFSAGGIAWGNTPGTYIQVWVDVGVDIIFGIGNVTSTSVLANTDTPLSPYMNIGWAYYGASSIGAGGVTLKSAAADQNAPGAQPPGRTGYVAWD